MRTNISIAVLAFCAVLAACDKTPEASKTSTYDLSADSNVNFLADYAAKPGVLKTKDGLEYRIIKSGAGTTRPQPDDIVSVRFKGSLINGTVFNQTPAGKFSRFSIRNQLRGWVEALSLMKEGDEWELVIPSDLAYGQEGAHGVIPGGQTLIFEMTLLTIEPDK